MTPRPPQRQRGMALLLAMLTVTLVASLAAAAHWQQWRGWQIEQAEQQRQQASWLLTGALDWARLILREDARASQVDHLAEPWAVPLQEARLSTFLANQDGDNTDTTLDAFVSGQVSDEQGRLNLRNLLPDASQGTLSEPDLAMARKLFALLGLPMRELDNLTALLPSAQAAPQRTVDTNPPLVPQSLAQLGWWGLSPTTLQALAPHATWLPERTPLNINTASAQALCASVPGLGLGQAQQLVQQRARQHFKTLDDVRAQFPALASQWREQHHGTTSRYFLVQGQLRLDGLTLRETSLVVRDGTQVSTLWRQRGVRPPSPDSVMSR